MLDYEKVWYLGEIAIRFKDYPTLKAIFDEAMKELEQINHDLLQPEVTPHPTQGATHATGHSVGVRPGQPPAPEARRV